MLFFHRGHTRMSTILFFTSDRFAFANLSPSATTEKIILTPDPVDGSRLFIGNSTMISYDARCNISTFDGSRATMTIDTLNNRVGIGISSPTVALDIVDAGGVRIVGPTNITGATTFTGNSRVVGIATATSFTGSGIGLTSIPAARIVGSLPAAVYANATIPVAALSGYDNGSLLLSGHLATETLNVSTITAQQASFSSLSSGSAGIDTLSVRAFSTAFGFVSTLTIGRLLAGSISSGSIGSLVTDSGSFNLVTAETADVNVLNTALLSTGAGTASSFTVGILYAATISSGSIVSLSSALVSVSNTGVTNTTNITTISNNIITASNAGVANTTNITTVSNTVNYLLAVSNVSAVTMSTSFGFFSTISAGTVFGRFVGDGSLLTNLPVTAALATVSNNLTTVSNAGTTNTINITTVSNNLTTVSNTGATNTTNITTVSNTVNYLLAVSNISAITISTTYGFFSTISAGTVFGRFVGDGSLLTNLPITTALTTVSNNLTTVSNTGATNTANITTVSNTGAANTTNITTVSNTVNYLLAVSNISAITMSTSYGFFSSISAGTIFARFVGDGSGLTGIASGGVSIIPPILSTTLLSTGILTARNISTTVISTSYGFFSTISAGTIFARFLGDGSGLTGIASGGVSIIPPVLSTTLLSTGILTASNISTAVISTNTGFASSFFVNRLTTSTVTALLGSFSSISAGQAYISSLTVDSLFIGNDIGYTNMGDVIATSLSTIQVTAANLITVNISATIISTNYGFFSTISAGTIFGRFVGDGSALTGIASGGLIIPPLLSTTFLSTGFLSARNISSLTMSTNYGFFSTISAGTVFGRFVGDGSLLTNLPVTAAFTTVSNTGVTNTTNITTVSNTVNYLLAVSNISAVTMSTSYGFFSTISAGTVFGRFVGDGSLLTGIVGASGGMSIVPPVLSTTLLSTGILTARSISTTVISSGFGFFSTISAGSIFGRFVGDGSGLTGLPVGVTSVLSTQAFYTSSISSANITSVQGYISSLIVDSLTFGLSNSYISMGNVIATSISTIQTFTSSLLTINLQVGNVSSLSYIAFPGLQQGYAQSIIAEQSTGTGTQELLFYKGSTTTDRIRMQTTGSIVFEPGVSARVFPAVGSNVTPAMIINASSNVGIGIAVPTVALDVAGTGRFQILSTQQLFVSSISSGLVYGRFAGDGSLLTGIVGASGGLSYIPPVLSTTLLSTANLTASTINTDILNACLLSTASGTASSFTIGSIFGSSGSISSLRGNEARISTVTANTLSSYIVYASSINTPNIYVTNIYANDSGIANVVASSLNASRAVFVQVIASSFQGSLIGKNLLVVETY